MNYTTKDGITVIEGLEAIRRRPAMFVGTEEPGRSLRSRLLEVVVDGIAHDTPKPREIRIMLWRDGVTTVAYDGEPIPIEPFSRPVDGVAHPRFYQFFLYLLAGSDPFGRSLAFGTLLNALSDRLVVSTIHGRDRYRAVFSRGMIVTLLTRTPCETRMGTTWFTFCPDESIISGAPLSETGARAAADRVIGEFDIPVLVHDRTTEAPDWY